MTHWYREPKRMKLMEPLERAGIAFVLSSDELSQGDLLNLRTVVPIGFAGRDMPVRLPTAIRPLQNETFAASWTSLGA